MKSAFTLGEMPVLPIALKDQQRGPAAAEMIDYEVLYTGIKWGDSAFMARLRAAELCEILVPDFIPLNYFEEGFPNG